ncbi:MAG: hypothetical protein AB8G96_05345 [Phycisphaerales bacterium]
MRCDHDLQGEILTWTTTCPLAGRCPECGLRFAWRELLSPVFGVPRWSVEAKESTVPLVFRLFIHGWKLATRPRQCWRATSMRQPVRAHPLVGLLVFWVAMVVAALYVIAVVGIRRRTGMSLDEALGIALRPFAPAFQSASPFVFFVLLFKRTLAPWTLGLLAMPMVGTLTLFLLPDTRRGGAIHPRHLVRIGLSAQVLAVIAASVIGIIAAWIRPGVDFHDMVRRDPSVNLTLLIGAWSLGVLLVHGVLAGGWCTMVARHHLRLAQPARVGWTVGGICGLAASVIWVVGFG